MIVISERTEYVGAHITPAAKDALKGAAASRQMSLSAWVAEAVEKKLIEDGFPPQPVDNGPKPILDVAESVAE